MISRMSDRDLGQAYLLASMACEAEAIDLEMHRRGTVTAVQLILLKSKVWPSARGMCGCRGRCDRPLR